MVAGFFTKIVPRTGFEPVIPALKGRCPRPLDERGVYNTVFVLLSGFYSIAIALSSETTLIQGFLKVLFMLSSSGQFYRTQQ